MLHSRRTFIGLTLLISAFTLCAICPRAMAAGVEGKWKVKIEPDEDARKGGEKTVDDTIVFTPTKFHSEAFKKRGFGETAYEEDARRFGPSNFTIEQKSEKEGKMKWTGTATAVDITGDIVLTKKDGTEVRFIYKGTKPN